MKISVIGTGHVGGACVERLAAQQVASEIVLCDTRPGLAEGMALDIWQRAAISGSSTRLQGTAGDYGLTAGSTVVVIAAGRPRAPGMSRDDLAAANAAVVRQAADQAVAHSPDAVLLVVTNPLDVMTWEALQATGLPRSRVLGMAGMLDTARFRAGVAGALDVSPADVQVMLLGGHGDTMVPLPRFASVSGMPLTQLLDTARVEAVVARTRTSGGDLVKLLGTSAWHAAGAAAAEMVAAVVGDQKRVMPASVRLAGEYGISDCCLGVPVVLGRRGIERIIELQLSDAEYAALERSRRHVAAVIRRLAPPG